MPDSPVALLIQNAVASLRFEPVVQVLDQIQNRTREFALEYDPLVVEKADYALAQGSALSADFPIMNPFHAVVIALAYLGMIFFGNQIMKNFAPFSPKAFQLFHNLVLTILSAWLTVEVFYHSHIVHGFTHRRNPFGDDPAQIGLARVLWVFYFSKILDFGDTLIMVLKKSTRQMTFLHIYHHTSVFLIWWVVIYYGPGGDAAWGVLLNSSVHTVMYSYYLLSTFYTWPSKLKPFITLFQLLQFVLLIQQSFSNVWQGFGEPEGGLKLFLSWILFLYSISLFVLFMNFFIKDRKRAAAARHEAAILKERKKIQ